MSVVVVVVVVVVSHLMLCASDEFGSKLFLNFNRRSVFWKMEIKIPQRFYDERSLERGVENCGARMHRAA